MSCLIDFKILVDELQKWFVNDTIHKNDLAEVLVNLPTVDAKPVVHGSWEKTRLAGEYECSNCHSIEYESLTKSGFKLPNFCPNCGADMRKKVQE